MLMEVKQKIKEYKAAYLKEQETISSTFIAKQNQNLLWGKMQSQFVLT